MHTRFDQQFNMWLTQLPFSGLRSRLLLLLLLALLPAYSFISYSVFESYQQATENARGNALWLARLMASEQKSLIDVIRQQLQSLAQLQLVRRPEQAALCNQTFADMQRQNSLYANMGVAGSDGVLRCSAVPFTGQINLSDRRYFSEAMSTRGFVISNYQIGRVIGKGVVTLAYPVLDSAGNPQAVVFIALDLAALAGRLLETTGLPEGSTLTILDNHGTILVRQPDAEKWVGKALPDAPLIRLILAHGKEGSTKETGLDGIERLYVYAPISSASHASKVSAVTTVSAPARQIYVSVGIPTNAVYADASALLFRALLLMVLVTTIVITLAWVGGRTLLLRPVNALINAARQLGHGNLSARTGLAHTADEFGQMARSFDDMASALEAQKTEAIRAEEEIHRLNADLERRVVERTTELQAANKELEAFSYSVSHDLRAPLRAIDGFSQAILEDYADKLDESGRHHLNRVRTATQRMSHLIDDLIKLAQVARAEMTREEVDLSALADDVLVTLQKRDPDRRVAYQVEPGLTAEGDAQLLRVVLDNLLGNAWKFTSNTANAKIEFGTMRNADDATEFFVRDNGAGFDMTYADKLFGAFQRLHSLGEFPGTGIGLATVQRIIHRHGGRVWAEGAVGKGATFYFSL